MPNDVPHGIGRGVPNDVQCSHGISRGVPNDVRHGISRGVPNDVRHGIGRRVPNELSPDGKKGSPLSELKIHSRRTVYQVLISQGHGSILKL